MRSTDSNANVSDDDPDPIVTRSIAIFELMDADGSRRLSFDPDGGMETWDIIGFLESALLWYRAELTQLWDQAASLADGDD